ncbi:hypothetical protein [Geodermatophilus marinus]|uniref:hypothetical protein n=1 Tax=Geodermatophilus sp. LHW52908 TaxID=2303986 RepID=UPI000E3C96A5|nr:hypothetical protein [Geodermatophilus sp. LHW52908]RFU21603.1 hypothetical protein D0Z06_10420 [Geodermatophilus sp. LHW52908]
MTRHGTPGDGTAGGDLGYDTVHEGAAQQGAHQEREYPPAGSGRGPVPPRPEDVGGDLSYDESHDFRR